MRRYTTLLLFLSGISMLYAVVPFFYFHHENMTLYNPSAMGLRDDVSLDPYDSSPRRNKKGPKILHDGYLYRYYGGREDSRRGERRRQRQRRNEDLESLSKFSLLVRNFFLAGENQDTKTALTYYKKNSEGFSLGAEILRRKFFIETQNDIYGNLLYKVKLSQQSILNLGLKLGLSNNVIRFSDVDLGLVTTDPSLPADENSIRVDVGTGASFQTTSFSFGLGFPRMLSEDKDVVIHLESLIRLFKDRPSKLRFAAFFQKDQKGLYAYQFSQYINSKLSAGLAYQQNSIGINGTVKLNDYLTVNIAFQAYLKINRAYTFEGATEFSPQ